MVVVLGAWVQAGVYRTAQNDSYTLAGRTRWIPRLTEENEDPSAEDRFE